MSVQVRKPFLEEFARFYEAPSRETLRSLLQNNIGELKNTDFKAMWPTSPKVAKHVLAFANSGGGVLIFGVRERDDKTLETCGLESLTDKAQIIGSLKRFLPSRLLGEIEIADFAYEAAEYPTIIGRKFQALFVLPDDRHLPYLATADSEDIRNNTVYVRRGAATVEATHDELQEIVSRRLATGYSSRAELDVTMHVEQLKLLYEYLPFGMSFGPSSSMALLGVMAAASGTSTFADAQTFDEFIAETIILKKRLIRRLLGVAT